MAGKLVRILCEIGIPFSQLIQQRVRSLSSRARQFAFGAFDVC
jgi:hypothetical protein